MRVFPVAAGEELTAKLAGTPLEGARIRFV
jgi:hypothetical protein